MQSTSGSKVTTTTTTTAPDINNESKEDNLKHSTIFQRGANSLKTSPRKKKFNSSKLRNSETSNTINDTSGTASLHRSIFKPKKIFNHSLPSDSTTQKNVQLKLRNKFASPTDRLLSPCSQKLNNNKTKFLLARSKPAKLAFGASNKPDDDEAMLDSDSDY